MPAGQDLEREPINRPLSSPVAAKDLTEKVAAQPGVKDIYPQIISTCIAHLLVVQVGINMAYSAILLPQLMDDPNFPITQDEASWIASLMAISTPVGAMVCGPGMDLLGRKLFSLLTTIPLALCWLLTLFTPNVAWTLYVARVLAGFGGGLTTVSLVYISEISNSSWRPMLLCLNSVFVSLGILLTNLLGVLLPWRVVALLAFILMLVTTTAIAVYNPESPYWLLRFRDSDKHFEQAKQSLRFLYPNQQMFAKEWERLVTASREKRAADGGLEVGEGILSKVKHIAGEFTKRSAFLPFFLLLIIFVFQQLSGTYPIIFYAVQVFQSIGGEFDGGLNADSATVMLGILRFVGSIITAGLSRTYGRRTLMIVSGVGMTVSSFITAVYFHNTCSFNSVFNKVPTVSNTSNVLNTTTTSINLIEATSSSSLVTDNHSSFLIGLICILFFVFMGSVGFLIIPWTLIGEILPLSIRGTGGGIICSFAYFLMFIIVKIFPYMMDTFHISGLFYFFSCTVFLCVIVVYFFLPETLGKSFEEIEQSFMKRRTDS